MIKEYELQQIDKIRREIKLLKEIRIDMNNENNRKKYNKLINKFQNELDKKIINLEYEIEKIDDSEIRTIIRYKYQCNYSWVKIMHLMNCNTEDAPRKLLKRFLEKQKMSILSVQ